MTAALLHDTQVISVKNEGEYATFYLRTGKEEKYEWAHLVIDSSFGTCSHYWNSMGKPARQFLKQISFDYWSTKLFGTKADVFDVDKTIETICKQVNEKRRERYFDKDRARELRAVAISLHEFDGDVNYFISGYLNTELTEYISEDCSVCYSPNRQAVGLWEKLWPEYLEMLEAEYQRLNPPCYWCRANIPAHGDRHASNLHLPDCKRPIPF